MKSNYKYIFAVISSLILITLFSTDLYSALGVGLFVFFGTKFFFEIGEKVEIRDIMIILATLQWIIGPLLAYTFYPNEKMYYMAVSMDLYMSYVVPASLAFIMGLYLPVWSKKHSDNSYLLGIKEIVNKNKNLDLILLLLGVFSGIIVDYVPLSLNFFVYLLSGLRFVGLYLLYISERKNKRIFIIFILGWLFITALNDTMFHEMFLWLGFFMIIVAFIIKPKMRVKLIFLIAILIFVAVIQTIKFSFREALLKGDSNKVELFSKLVQEQVLSGDYATSETNISAFVTRINQGWIIARIMSWTPSRESFANGETINIAIKSALIPRLLSPDKVTAGGRTYFTRFTGKDISENTSMGLSIMGEAYANYGIFGGSVFMFIIGLFYNFFIFMIFRIANNHPTIILFIPLLFLQVVKAETDFSVILNHLIKASIVVWFIFYSFNRFMKIRL
jgi:hypothetical protein